MKVSRRRSTVFASKRGKRGEVSRVFVCKPSILAVFLNLGKANEKVLLEWLEAAGRKIPTTGN